MNFYIEENQVVSYAQNTAGLKARVDVSEICKSNGFKKVEMPVKIERGKIY